MIGDTPIDQMGLYAVALLFGTRVAETILASVHVRAHPQAGHMDASNLIKALQNTLRGGGRPHMGLGRLSGSGTPSGWRTRRPRPSPAAGAATSGQSGAGPTWPSPAPSGAAAVSWHRPVPRGTEASGMASPRCAWRNRVWPAPETTASASPRP